MSLASGTKLGPLEGDLHISHQGRSPNELRFLFIALSAPLDVIKSWRETEMLTPERKIQLGKDNTSQLNLF
jgi:hypothetical protein